MPNTVPAPVTTETDERPDELADLRIGVLGYGLRSDLAGLAHRPGRGSQVVAVADPRPERRERARTEFGASALITADEAELLAAGLDAVIVLSPDHLHERQAVAVLEAGAAVYLEKPMAVSTAGCDRVLTAAQATGGRLYVGHNMRHMPVIQAMRRLILDGAIGEVKSIWCRHFVGHGGDFYFKDWHAERAKSTGLLLQKGAHDLDVIHWLAGGYSRRVQAMGALTVYGQAGRAASAAEGEYLPPEGWSSLDAWPPSAQTGLNPALDVEDLSLVNLALDNGVLASYQQCHYTPDYWRNYTVIGSAGRLENFGDGPGAEVRVWNTRHRGYAPEPDHTVPVGAADGGHGGADPQIMAEFLRFVRDGEPTLTSPLAAREAVAAGFAATESLRAGGIPVDVPLPPVGW